MAVAALFDRAAAAALGATLTAVALVPADGQYVTWTGFEPSRSICADPHDPKAKMFIERIGPVTLTMRYSGVCRAVWAVVEGAPAGTPVWVERPDGGRQSCTADQTGGCVTNLLDDANVASCGHAVVAARAVATDCY